MAVVEEVRRIQPVARQVVLAAAVQVGASIYKVTMAQMGLAAEGEEEETVISAVKVVQELS